MAVLGIAIHARMQPLVGIWKSYSGPETRAVQNMFSNSLKEIIEAIPRVVSYFPNKIKEEAKKSS